MNNFLQWLRRGMGRLGAGLRHFMAGRYGTDRLNTVILGAGLLLCLIRILVKSPLGILLTILLSYCCMFWALFRMLSRNTYRRYQENRRFLMLLERIKDRNHRYFSCPRCHQPVRVPRRKGKIAITCPKCRERFIRKT